MSMAVTRDYKRKRERKLLVGQKVEVRSDEEGFEGSWHSAVVVEMSRLSRRVEYDHILVEDASCKLIESIDVSPFVDGLVSECADNARYRGNMRPRPPSIYFGPRDLRYGLCVDVYYRDAWWEGVIFDRNLGYDKRRVFFPEGGDELLGRTANIRLTQDWNEVSGRWHRRGVWSFIELMEIHGREFPLPVSLKQIWYDLRCKDDFGKNIKVWTCCDKGLWEELLLETVSESLSISLDDILPQLDLQPNEVQWSSELLELTELTCEAATNPKEDPTNLDFVPFKKPTYLDIAADGNMDSELVRGDLSCTTLGHLQEPQTLHVSSKEISSQVRDDANTLVTSPDDMLMQLRNHCNTSKLALLSTSVILGAKSVICPQAIVERCTLTEHCTGETNSSDSIIQNMNAKKLSSVAGLGTEIVSLQLDAPPEQWPADHHSHSSSKEFPYLGKVKSIRSKLRKRRTNIKWHIIPFTTSGHKEVSANAVFDRVACKEVSMRRHNGTSHHSKSKQRISPASRKFRDMEAEDLLREEKVIRDVPGPSHHNSRSVLSWLIDNDVVLPRSKVRCKKEGRRRVTWTEGRISRDGIKCTCCGNVFTLSKFCLHARNGGMATSSIILEGGRSLLTCQLQTLQRKSVSHLGRNTHDRMEGKWQKGKSDIICSICHYGGELILCDHCPSGFHKSCLGLQEVPNGDWFCLSCRCAICGQSKMKEDDRSCANDSVLTCYQCYRAYHMGCLRKKGVAELEIPPQEYWYCSKKCKEISEALHELLGKRIKVGVKNITWTLLRSTNPNYHDLDDALENEAVIENDSKLSVAVEVMHECFEPFKDCYTRRDIIEDVIFSRGSKLGRLNFRGFYTILLEKGDEVVTVGAVRVHGEKVAEIPLVGTRFQFRRLGMCRILLGELEKRLKKMGVCKLILPAVPCVANTWTTSFGFTRMEDTEKLKFLDCNFLAFQDTIMCQKQLVNSPPTWLNLKQGVSPLHCDSMDGDGSGTEFGGSSPVSEVLQADPVEVGTVDQCLAWPIVDNRMKVQEVVNPKSTEVTPFAHVYKRYTRGKKRKLE